MRIRAQEGPQHPSSLPVPPRRPPQASSPPTLAPPGLLRAKLGAMQPCLSRLSLLPLPSRTEQFRGCSPHPMPPPAAHPPAPFLAALQAPRCSSSSSSSFKGPLVLLQPVQTGRGSPRLQGQARVPSAPSRCGSAPQPPSLSSARPPRRAGMGLAQAPEAGARPGAERRLPARHAASARGAHLGQHHQGHPPLPPRSLPPHQTTGWDRKKQGFVGRRRLWGCRCTGQQDLDNTGKGQPQAASPARAWPAQPQQAVCESQQNTRWGRLGVTQTAASQGLQ